MVWIIQILCIVRKMLIFSAHVSIQDKDTFSLYFNNDPFKDNNFQKIGI